MQTLAHIRGTADNLMGLAIPHIHPADAELVGVGVGVALHHMAHHHTGRPGCQILDALHLKAGDREALRQVPRLQTRRFHADQLPEPLERNQHRTVAQQPSTLGSDQGLSHREVWC